jgi:hypothetical protein
MKDKINFDPTDADSLAASDNIGAWVRAGTDGAQISSTLVSGKQGLDVNVISEINVDLDGIYNVLTNPAPDTVGNILNTRAAVPDETGQVERVTAAVASSDGVVDVNVHGQDVNAFGMGFNGTTWDRLKSTSGALNVSDGGGSLTVDGTVAVSSVGGTVAVTQSTSPWVVSGTVTANQGTSPWVVSDAALANTAMTNGAKSATTTASSIVSALANRKYLFYQNVANKEVYVGKDITVTSANGWKISPGSDIMLRCGAAIAPFVIGLDAGGSDTRYLEFS